MGSVHEALYGKQLASGVFQQGYTIPSGTTRDKYKVKVARNPRMSVATSYQDANPFYAGASWANKQFDQGNVYARGKGAGNLSYAAARSGVVNTGGYKAIGTPYEARSGRRSRVGRFTFTPPFDVHRQFSGISHSGLRLRMTGNIWRSTGWQGLLTQSLSSNKAMSTGAGGRGQSSEDSTTEVYSTQETRMGTRAEFTDEVWNEAKGKFGQTWAGFNNLGQTGGTPHLQAQLGQMYVRTNPNVGFARRVKRGL